MTVKELIIELEKVDASQKVWIAFDSGVRMPVEVVTEYEDRDEGFVVVITDNSEHREDW